MEVASSSKEEERSFKAAGGGGGDPRRQSRKCRTICLAVTAVVLVATVVLVILCFTVFKAREPEMTINSVVLKDLDVALNIPRLSVDVNLTLDVDLSVKNPNKAGFKYKSGSALLNYRGELVGQGRIGSGEISADHTKPMNVTLTIMADRFLEKSELFSDVMAGKLPFTTLTKVSGKVVIFGIFKFHVISTSSCDVSINVSNKTVGEQKCTRKTKL
ncbi:PREDICTED: late embryogenesis abundant [Prunus dulcis]|uniref:PREDICTED: late embryogenesis abundant n=1 Tax=Prunus dulcis TaxID=3755 RepID=A0A5E4EGB6_PRUDU|nr:uncharacterized protein LOC117632690 [Prunus dulcis]KAI5326155.1 hypothetical protein L3X38_035229 [Prunus dulcis]VVA14492.1 PREDICTED: late embryogenesis abundant [Prunus dulcis]